MCVDCGNTGFVDYDPIEALPESIKNRPIETEHDLHRAMSFIDVMTGGPGVRNVTLCRCRSVDRGPERCWWKDGICQERP